MKKQIGLEFLVPAYLGLAGCPGKEAVKPVCLSHSVSLSALMLLVGCQEGHVHEDVT